MVLEDRFSWTQSYMEFADRLLLYKENRLELVRLIDEASRDRNLPSSVFEVPTLTDICPFSVFGYFNRDLSTKDRRGIMESLGTRMGFSGSLPENFVGIPVLQSLRPYFFSQSKTRQEEIEDLWNLFATAIDFADRPSTMQRAEFVRVFDCLIERIPLGFTLTLGLFFIRPYAYLGLADKTREYLTREDPYKEEMAPFGHLKKVPKGEDYLQILSVCRNLFSRENHHESFLALSYQANTQKDLSHETKRQSFVYYLRWFAPVIAALRSLGGSGTPKAVREQIIRDEGLTEDVIHELRGKNETKKFDNEVAFARQYLVYEGYIDNSVRGMWRLTEKGRSSPMDERLANAIFLKWQEILKQRRIGDSVSRSEKESYGTGYFVYSLGQKDSNWEEFQRLGILAMPADELGDYRAYASKEAMEEKIKELHGEDYASTKQSLVCWQFAEGLALYDIVYVRKGKHTIIGRGIIESPYIYEKGVHTRKVSWTHVGEWEHGERSFHKVLTNVTSYTDFVEKLERCILEEDALEMESKREIAYLPYTREDFLNEVFMEEERYDALVSLLKMKKNLIVQGAPGVGKTFLAKRLAYSLLGKRDSSRVMMVQFHQGYSYEDFVMGYRPSKEGFQLETGPFYEFCKKAEEDAQDYFFIIDEINRGNLSRILGELLLLMEKDKRGEKIRLVYSNELFSVPKNLYIIGMMNTADRSLALIDYALRRRFAFFTLHPAFDSFGFESLILESNHPAFVSLISQVKLLNEEICKDESLGEGFQIGHSYFCIEEPITLESLRAIVEFELLPLLKEYWFDEERRLETWKARLYGALKHD